MSPKHWQSICILRLLNYQTTGYKKTILLELGTIGTRKDATEFFYGLFGGYMEFVFHFHLIKLHFDFNQFKRYFQVFSLFP